MPAVFNNAQKLQALGFPGPLAVELMNQISANTGNSRRLKDLGLGGVKLCDYIAASIQPKNMNAVQAARLDLDVVQAKALAALINA